MNFINNISWDWVIVISLIILFVVILYSLIKDIKKTKVAIKNKIVEEKCKSNLEKEYLSDINSNKLATNKKLKNNIIKIKDSDINSNNKIIKNLYKNYKEIHLSDREEEIFLNIAMNKQIGEEVVFNFQSFIDELVENEIINKIGDTFNNYNLVANKRVIEDIFLLLNKLQTKEHGYEEASFIIKLKESNNTLSIKVDKKLELNQHLKKVLTNNLTPIYLPNNRKKYYGVYLYLIKELANRINALVRIESNGIDYKISLDIPIDIKEEHLVSKKPNKVLKITKNALIITDNKKGYLLTQYLKNLNFNISIESAQDLNKEIPNFMEFDIIFMDSKLFEPILTDYLETIKEYSNLKIVALLDQKNKLYPAKLVDEVINMEEIDNTIYKKVLKLYDNEVVSLNKIKNSDSNEVIQTISSNNKKILIADDDKTNLHILTSIFKQYNIEVITKENGKEVLQYLDKDQNIDLIILDSIMPVMDGYETIKEIRKDSRFNATPIVIHSSFSMIEGRMEKIFELGFDSFLPKPFNKNDIESLLDRYIALDKPKCQEDSSSEVSSSDLKEFIAIYGDSDKMIKKYIKENREEQALSLLKDLKDIAQKIEAKKFLNSIDSIEQHLNSNKEIDNSLIYNLSSNLQELKSDIMKRLSA